jgi:hypothetical protein
MEAVWVVLAVAVAVVAASAALNLWARRAGYAIPGRTAVRCSKGHLFRRTWVMGGSLTAVRLGPLLRYGRCPVGHHWTLIRPVKEADLTEAERRTLTSEAGA